MPSKRTILLIDDHPFLRAGVAQLIGRQPDLTVCGEAKDPESAFAELNRQMPDLILSDLTLPGRGGLEFIKDLKTRYENLLILVVSMHDETMYAERALRAGARGYIMKEAGGEMLLIAIRRVLGGESYVSSKMAAKVLDDMAARRPRGSSSPIGKLTDREFEIFQLIGNGKGTRGIAEKLHLSPKTIDVHRSHIKAKLGLTDATALIRHAVRWVELPGGAE